MAKKDPDACPKGGEHNVVTDTERREGAYWYRVRCTKCGEVFKDWHK